MEYQTVAIKSNYNYFLPMKQINAFNLFKYYVNWRDDIINNSIGKNNFLHE